MSQREAMSSLALALVLAAAGEPFDVTWDAPDGCGSADEVSRRAAVVLDDALDRGEDFERVVAHGRVAATSDGAWQLELSYRAGGIDELRTFDAPDCEGLVEGAALVLAVAATPMIAPTTPPPVRDDPPAPVQREPEPTRHRVGVALRAEAGVLAGLVGPVWPGLGGSIALRYRAFRFEVGGVHVFARRHVLHDEAFAAGAGISLSAAILRGCGVPTAARGRVEFPICLGAVLGGATARAFGDLEGARTRRSPWVAVLAGPGIAIPIRERLAVSLSVDAVVSVLRPGFRVDSLSPEVWRAALVSARATFGFEVRLP